VNRVIRLSPALMAVLATSAALGWVQTAAAQDPSVPELSAQSQGRSLGGQPAGQSLEGQSFESQSVKDQAVQSPSIQSQSIQAPSAAIMLGMAPPAPVVATMTAAPVTASEPVSGIVGTESSPAQIRLAVVKPSQSGFGVDLELGDAETLGVDGSLAGPVVGPVAGPVIGTTTSAPVANVPAPVVNVPAPVVNVPAPVVNVSAPVAVAPLAGSSGNVPMPAVSQQNAGDAAIAQVTLPKPTSPSPTAPKPLPPRPLPPRPASGTAPRPLPPRPIPAPQTPPKVEVAPAKPSSPTVTPPSSPLPTTPPGSPGSFPSSPAGSSQGEPRVLVSEIQVKGVEGNPDEAKLLDAVYSAIQTRPGLPTTSSQLQADLNAVFGTGYFANVDFTPEDTALGVKITFVVQPNPTLKDVRTDGATVLPADILKKTFAPQYGQVLNFNELQTGVKLINRWYQDQGYVLAQVIDATKVSPDGVVTLSIAEGVVDSIDVTFVNVDGLDKDPDGKPLRGRTQEYVIKREFSLQPGSIFNRAQAEKDLQRLAGLGIFQDVHLDLKPAESDPKKVVVVAQVVESRTGSIGASGGFSSSSGIFGSLSLGQENFRGRNQKLRSEITLGQRDFLFDLSYTDPWLKGDKHRTAMVINGFRRSSSSLIFTGGDRDVNLPNGDSPRILRTGAGIQFSRPLSKNVFEPSEWSASLGLQYQRVAIRDSKGRNRSQDELGNDLTFSGDKTDDLVLAQMGLARDHRNDRLQPTSGSISRLTMDQSIPIGSGSILFNRVRLSHSQYLPFNVLKFSEGCRKAKPSVSDCPQTLAFNIQAGTILGDLPPYEAFALGGANSVRGWSEGSVGSGRNFLQLTAEYRFPLFSFVGGALFADYGTDLGSGKNVPGQPAEIRDKPGNGYGIGIGVRVKSPLGPIRADYSILTEGDTKFQFGIGERF
jgi:outer membrane protein insertion porin family